MEYSTIREYRVAKRVTQEQLAHELGVTVSTVNRWERGHVKPSRLARKALAELGIGEDQKA